jgi:hypothetical protein
MAAKMEHDARSNEVRFSEYVESLFAVLGRDGWVQSLRVIAWVC